MCSKVRHLALESSPMQNEQGNAPKFCKGATPSADAAPKEHRSACSQTWSKAEPISKSSPTTHLLMLNQRPSQSIAMPLVDPRKPPTWCWLW